MPRIRAVLRVVVPALLIVAWLAGASFGGPLFGKIDEVSSNDQTAYLPSSAEATEVQQRLDEFNDSDKIPAIAVFTSEDPLGDEAQASIGDAVAAASADASPALLSDDGLAMQAFIPLDSPDDVPELGETLRADAPDGVTVQITGPAGFSADLISGFAGIDGLLLGVALGAVLVILVLVYRSALLPFVVLATSLFALCVAGGVVAREMGRPAAQRADPGDPLHPGDRRRDRLRTPVRLAFPRGAATHDRPGTRDPHGVEGLTRADRGLGRHRHRRPALPPAERSEVE
jgi:uncharacterized membrane protein YdfJ with MMPL/SSD domain